MIDAISVTDVRKNYGNIEALAGLSLNVREGEIFGLLGANGAGKTTLIKILVGALKCESGTVQVLNSNPSTDKHTLRPRVGYMPQQIALYEDLTARENVRFFGRARAVEQLEQRIRDVLTFVNLSDRADEPVHRFSGGMQQRVSLACALVHQPRLLLLDEPSTGIDPKLRESLWSHFRNLADDGVTIVVSTHQMDEAVHCDRVAVMRGGRALAVDSPDGLLARGTATVTLWNGEESQVHVLGNYREELPHLLGIESQVSRIVVREQSLEDIVLHLISEKEQANV